MKVTIAQVQTGAAAYIDREIIGKLPEKDWRRWGLGIAAAMYLKRLPDFMQKIPEIKELAALRLLDESGMVDIDEIYTAAKTAASSFGPIELHIPSSGAFALLGNMGSLTLSADDIDKLYQAILSA